MMRSSAASESNLIVVITLTVGLVEIVTVATQTSRIKYIFSCGTCRDA